MLKREFRLQPGRSCNLRPSVTSHNVQRQFHTHVSVQPVGPIWKGQEFEGRSRKHVGMQLIGKGAGGIWLSANVMLGSPNVTFVFAARYLHETNDVKPAAVCSCLWGYVKCR
jgi:hypothetical protein